LLASPYRRKRKVLKKAKMMTKMKRWYGKWFRKYIFFAAGIAATFWFLIRVIPKPSRVMKKPGTHSFIILT